MTDKEFRIQEARVKKYLDQLKKQLGFYAWKFDSNFHSTMNPESPGIFSSTVCSTSPRWEYLFAEFDWFLPMVQKCTDRELRYVVAHELSHLWLSRTVSGSVDEQTRKLHELSATEIGWAIVWSEEAAAKEAVRLVGKKGRKKR